MPTVLSKKQNSQKKKTRRSNPVVLIALDTETTGLDLRHGCKPFLISTCTEQGETKCWEWPVDPITRRPSPTLRDRREIAAYLQGASVVFHNAKFDLRALSEIGFDIYFQQEDWLVSASADWEGRVVRINLWTYEDTTLASHASSSSDSRKLKELGIRYLRYADTDQKTLSKAVLLAANHCRSNDVEVNLAYSLTQSEKTGKRTRLTEADYWLPKFVDPNDCTCLTYATSDVERTILLWTFYRELMTELDVWKGYEREKALLRTVYKMETGGITINRQKVVRKLAALKKKRDLHGNRAKEYGSRLLKREMNLDSPKDLPELLYKKLKLPCESFTPKKNPSTDKKALGKLIERVSHKNSPDRNPKATSFLRDLIIYRAYLGGTRFLKNYLAYGITHHSWDNYAYLYPSLNQHGAGSTTRFSSSNPNGQNVSKIVVIEGPDGKPLLVNGEELEGPRLRDVFSPLPGKIWYAIDYSQLELRIFAAVSKEKSLIEALRKGYDFHGFTATKIFGKPYDQITKQERRIAKNTNFAIIFGASPWKVDQTAGMSGAYDQFAGLFPNVASFMQEMIGRAKKDGYVRTVFGYRLDVPHNAPYKIVSYLVQGTAGDIIKNAMIKIDQKQLVNWQQSRIALQIHDELILEFQKADPDLPSQVFNIMRAMEEAGEDIGIYTPVECDQITTDWGHGQKVDVTKKSIVVVKKEAA